MVGPTGFEPATPSPPAKCATRLRYGPTQMQYRCFRNLTRQAFTKIDHLQFDKCLSTRSNKVKQPAEA